MKKFLTVNDLFKKVWKIKWAQPRYQESGYDKQVLHNFHKNIEPIFGEKQVHKITRKDVKQWHSEMMLTPIAANRSLSVLTTMFNIALDMEWIEINPLFKIKPHTEKKRSRYASKEEIKRLWDVITETREAHPVVSVFLITCLFTGSRPKALSKIHWDEYSDGMVSFDGKGTADSGEKEFLIIPDYILEMWKTLPQRKDGLVFGPVRYGEIWTKICEKAQTPNLWARDLRRTYAAVGFSNGVKMDVISELLNHKSVQTTKIYAKLMPDARLEVASQIAGHIGKILKGAV